MIFPHVILGMDEQSIQGFFCFRARFVLLQVSAILACASWFFFAVYTCKASTSDALITPDKLVSIVSCGSVTDFIAEYTHICEFRLQK